jgi:PAS domain S-box-containing protein
VKEVLQAIAVVMPGAIVGLNREGLVEFWNPGAAAIFGWTEQEMLGQPLPPSLGVLRATHFEVSSPARAKDGRLLDIDLRTAQLRSGGTLLLAADFPRTTASERESAARAKAEGRLRELLEAAPDAIIEVDREGRIVLLNKVAQKLFGYKREELLGASVDMLLPEAIRTKHEAHRAGYSAHPSTRPMGQGLTLSARRRDGTELPVEISLSPIRIGDSLTVMAIVRDVTERRIFEQELKKAYQELEARNREVEHANQLKSEFLASMSHELRTPLHTIIGFTELLKEESQGPLNEPQKRFIGHVHRDSVHLLELINDILDLSKIEANQMELQIESFDAREVVQAALAGIIPAAQAKDIDVENRLDRPVYVLADRIRFREIVSNLMSNAVKFTPKGGRVWVEASLAELDTAAISVFDTGIGIALADQDVIFDRFRQVGPATSGVREGTGLGLAIVKRLVEMHGGNVRVESSPGEGSVFTFTVPVDMARLHTQPLVLIIEDEPGGRDLLASYLEPLGIRTEFAATADAGIALARRIRPDAITLDLMLPDHSGWRVLEELRSTPEMSAVPVFVVSMLDKDRAAVARGATDYLQKPLSRDVLVRALREHAPERFGDIESDTTSYDGNPRR